MSVPVTSGLVAHYDADDNTSVTKDGSGIVSAMDDLAGTYDLAQATSGSRPKHDASPVDKGHPGSPAYLANYVMQNDQKHLYSSGNPLHGESACTMFAVYDHYNPWGGTVYIASCPSGTNNGVDLRSNENGFFGAHVKTDTGSTSLMVQDNSSEDGYDYTDPIIQVLSWDGGLSSNHMKLRVQREQIAQTDRAGSTLNCDGDLTIGDRNTGANLLLRGNWAEVLIYDRALSTSEIQQVENYLYGKWIEATAPVLTAAATDADGDTITLTFDKAMADPAGKHGEFSFKVDSVGRTFSAAALDVDTTKINLTVVGANIAHGEVVTVSYTKGTVVAADAVALESFTDQPVVNNLPEPAVIVLQSAVTNTLGTIIRLTFNKNMASPVGKHAEFSFNIGATARTFSAAALASNITIIELTVSGDPIDFGDTLTVNYVKGTVLAADAVALESFSGEAVTNNVPSSDVLNIQTDALGVATVDLPDGSYSYKATKSGKNEASDTFVVAGSVQTINITLTDVSGLITAIDPNGDVPDTVVDATPKYYVKSTGNDANSGLSDALAWQTLTKVNATSFSAGDVIAFNRGDEWYGSLTPPSSGSAGSPIVFTAYGTGDKPVIHGWETLESWTDEGSNVYSKVDAGLLSTIRVLTIDGVYREKGRYPKKADSTGNFYNGWHPISTAGTNQWVQSNDLSGAPNFAGGEIVINKNDWVIETGNITSHSGTTIYYSGTSSYEASTSHGFFIQNHANCLTEHGDWWYDAANTKVYIYLDTAASNYVIKVSSVDDLVDLDDKSDNTFQNLSLEGSNRTGVRITHWRSLRTTIEGCDFLFSGQYGVYFDSADGPPDYATIQDCLFEDTNITGIFTYNSRYINSYRNVFRRTFLDPAHAPYGDPDGRPMNFGNGYRNSDFNIIGNRIYWCGATGINFRGSNVIVQKNIVYKFAQVSVDCGGIKTIGSQETIRVAAEPNHKHEGRIVSENIILAPDYVAPSMKQTTFIMGLYFDNNSPNIVSNDNIVIGLRYGMFNNTGYDIEFKRNIMYECEIGVYFQEYYSSPLITGWDFQENIFYDNVNQAVFINNIYNQNIANYGTFNNNYYIKPAGGNQFAIRAQSWGATTQYTLAQWQALAHGHDSLSVGSPTTSAVSALHYNPNYTGDLVVDVGASKIDKDGNTIVNQNVTLTPFDYILVLE
jgi:hypothetical protein